MPEQQASPFCSQPSALENNQQPTNQQDATSSTLAQEAKRNYLSLLPQSQLIDLLLAIDVNRDTTIFPSNLDEAISSLQRSTQPPAGPSAGSVIVKSEPTTSTLPSLVLSPSSTNSPSQPAALVPPSQPPPVPPPQYKPPPPKPVYPYTHTPYYPLQPAPPPPPTGQVSPPSAPARHPLFTSAPLSRDPNKLSLARPTPPPAPVSSRDDPNAMPSYEEMLVEAIMDVGDQDGTAPKVLFSWMALHYPLQQNFRPSASQALHKALKRGRLEKVGGKYRLNPTWGGGPTTSKRATRRPTANRALSPSQAHTPPKPPRPPTVLPPPYHTPYGYYAPHPYAGYTANGTFWIAGQPLQPVAPQPQQTVQQQEEVKNEDMEEEEEEAESEEERNRKEATSVFQIKTLASLDMEETKKEDIKTSLLRLARVLRRFAKKGEGTEMQGNTAAASHNNMEV